MERSGYKSGESSVWHKGMSIYGTYEVFHMAESDSREEVAAAALFPGSNESSYVIGIDRPVDGGMGSILAAEESNLRVISYPAFE